MVTSDRVKIIDASTAHRTAHGWTYGFPEHTPSRPREIAASMRVSNPGCYATGAIAMLYPLVEAGILSPDYPATINAVSGYSGGGKSLIAAFEDEAAPSHTDSNFYLYGLKLAHKHTPEIHKQSGLTHAPLFVPSVGRFAQGMIVSLPLQLWSLPGKPGVQDVHATLAAYYEGRDGPRGVRVAPLSESAALPDKLDPETLNDTDAMTLHVFANESREQALVCAVLDNLGKGAAGQAVQNLDLMLGLSELSVVSPQLSVRT
jgi:N-acetyl-gamma-glutamyl-phosphate reductase